MTIAITNVAYGLLRPMLDGAAMCAAGRHLARGTTDRSGAVAFVCTRCPAVREQGDPTWRR